MTTREEEIAEFLSSTRWSAARHAPLAGDASSRQYRRLHHANGDTAILMDAPQETGEDIRPFLRIAQFLTENQLSAPEIWHSSEALGLILMEDFGDALFVAAIAERSADEPMLYQAATDVLLDLHQHTPPPKLSVMDNQTLAQMTDLAFIWYGSESFEPAEKALSAFTEAFLPKLEKFLPAPSVLALRDYHAENLIWLPNRTSAARVGLLDFQDALMGHPCYDLVSLLQDARRDVPDDVAQATKKYYLERTGADPDLFEVSYSLLGLQRNLRILGVFARLCKQAGKPHYVDFIPRVYGHVMRNLVHPELSQVAEILRPALPEPSSVFLQSLRDQCAKTPKP
ncbi:phosphotransferase [Shimia sp. R10_1]|uniref:aminoglycoside phosphotransferase family protein n=1 Tax=Shimia sp. R10_1 TaxID=2821095 RepID=UPI001ADBCF75|nr:phosphotransferase [Shimia sp. R10_1]MBO9473678.1 phosphotransferase [Shimia sp. R10_1]